MQIYATSASSSLIFLKNRDKGTVVLLSGFIICEPKEKRNNTLQ